MRERAGVEAEAEEFESRSEKELESESAREGESESKSESDIESGIESARVSKNESGSDGRRNALAVCEGAIEESTEGGERGERERGTGRRTCHRQRAVD